MKAKRGRMLGHHMKIYGGPWNGKDVFIPIGGTMVFRLGPFHGSYNSAGEWKDVGSS